MASVTGGTISETEGAIATDCVDDEWMVCKGLGDSLYTLHNERWRSGTLMPVIDIS
jgi:hypothetical protein